MVEDRTCGRTGSAVAVLAAVHVGQDRAGFVLDDRLEGDFLLIGVVYRAGLDRDSPALEVVEGDVADAGNVNFFIGADWRVSGTGACTGAAVALAAGAGAVGAVAVAVALGEGFVGVADAASGVAFGSVLGGEAQAAAVSRMPVRVVAAKSRAARVFKLSPN